MDYHAIHGHDVSSFDIIPTSSRSLIQSASQILEEIDNDGPAVISTGLATLDAALSASLDSVAEDSGIPRGHVTEIWGPPGAGKTSFGIQLTANCLCEGRGVVWVDGFHPLPSERLRAAVGAVTKDKHDEADAAKFLEEAFTHYTCPSLPHFIALLCQPTEFVIAAETCLVIIDSLSALVNHAFPRMPEPRNVNGNKGGNKGSSLAERRHQVLRHIIDGLQKLASSHNVAVVVLTQCATKMQSADRGATLIPAINASGWGQGIHTRLVLFRDWIIPDGAGARSLHLVGIQKHCGEENDAFFNKAYAFDITSGGLVAVDCDSNQQTSSRPSVPAHKRKLADTDLEIAASDDDEDYGWGDDDGDEAANVPMPSQWQGSEDILLHPRAESDEEEEEEEEDQDPQHNDDQERERGPPPDEVPDGDDDE
ncbi:P-loop containing nucleoside triphosphate hydrolase protein [Diplogelasinospora grovesii]|uniref:P-loop containing nucleoside triphosphate hydrolase protein n=1 Tax=Diplogelasinospora grovesii TaxID=303347 RepID=A0AAN6N5V9_9PEZI|nr:P-loop containing nucleoside triphosphate hydrolase protein [Diplogelasinospora grovesii]